MFSKSVLGFFTCLANFVFFWPDGEKLMQSVERAAKVRLRIVCSRRARLFAERTVRRDERTVCVRARSRSVRERYVRKKARLCVGITLHFT